MPISAAAQFGGDVSINVGAGPTTLKWGPLRRLQRLTPTVALAEVELPPADDDYFPDDLGLMAFVIANVSGSNSIHLVDQEGYIDETLAPGEAAIISRVVA